MVKEILHGIDTILKPFHDARTLRNDLADQVGQKQADKHWHTAILGEAEPRSEIEKTEKILPTTK